MIHALATVAACTVIDDNGHMLTLTSPAQRVISLAPDLTESLFTIRAGAQIVGVMRGSDYPKAALAIPVVGSATGVDLERVVSLHPDLIVAWGDTFPREIAAFKRWGVPVYVARPRHIQDVSHTLQQLGCLTGHAAEASRAAAVFSRTLAGYRKRYRTTVPIRVFFQIGQGAPLTVNQDSWISDVMTLCGGHNVFASARTKTLSVSWETVLAADPQVVVSDTPKASWQASWRRFPKLAAVQNNRLYAMNPDIIERAGPRLLQGVGQMCDWLHQSE